MNNKCQHLKVTFLRGQLREMRLLQFSCRTLWNETIIVVRWAGNGITSRILLREGRQTHNNTYSIFSIYNPYYYYSYLHTIFCVFGYRKPTWSVIREECFRIGQQLPLTTQHKNHVHRHNKHYYYRITQETNCAKDLIQDMRTDRHHTRTSDCRVRHLYVHVVGVQMSESSSHSSVLSGVVCLGTIQCCLDSECPECLP